MKRKDDGIDVEGRAPGFFLYPSDLERELRPLPVGAQALWTRMLLQMHFGKRRGYLEHSTGEPFTPDDIGRMVGMPLSQVNRHLTEMEHKYGTFSRDEKGVIFNRRMVKDTAISESRKAAGKAGGNPVLLKQIPILDNQNSDLLNQSSKQNELRGSTRARSSSSSSFSSSKPDDKESLADHFPGSRQNGNSKSVTTTDETKKFATPKDELVALMQETTKHTPEVGVVRKICETVETRGGTLPEYLADIRPRIGRLHDPPAEGFFLSQAKKWASNETAPAPQPELVEAKNGRGRCAKCDGVGLVDGKYCTCRMGRDLNAIESRKKQPQTEAS